MTCRGALRILPFVLALTALVTTAAPQHTGAAAPAAAPPANVGALGVSQSAGVVYAAALGGLYRSDAVPYDRWESVNSLADVPQPVQAIAPNPTQPRELLLIAGRRAGARAYSSDDGGVTLTAQTIFTATGTVVTHMAWAQPDPRDPTAPITRLYATGDNPAFLSTYVARSDDGGRSWRQVLENTGSYQASGILSLAVAPGNGGDTVLVAMSGYHGGDLWGTQDGGATWSNSSLGPELAAPPVQSSSSEPDYVAVSPADAASVWCLWDGVLWHSADGGRTWIDAHQGIGDASFRGIEMQFLPRLDATFMRLDTALYRSQAGRKWERLQGIDPLGSSMVAVWRSDRIVATTAAGQLIVLDGAQLRATAPETPTGTWTGTTPAVGIDHGQTATLLQDGTVLLTGGSSPTRAATIPGGTAESQVFDPGSGHWRRGPAMHDARTNHTATLLADGRVLVAGGFDAAYNELSSVEIYDLRTHLWTMAAPLRGARGAHTATLLRDHHVLVAGGLDHKGEAIIPTELYAPATATWTDAGSLPREVQGSRNVSGAVLLRTGEVLLLMTSEDARSMAAMHSARARSWGVVAATPLAGLAAAMSATLHDGRLLIAGGYMRSGVDISNVHTVSIYDPAKQTWSAAAPMPTARSGGAAVTMRDGRVLVVGGSVKAGDNDAAEIYDPATNRWSQARSMLHAHGNAATATLLRDGRVLVAGGGKGAGAEIFDPGYHFTPATQPAATTPGALYIAATDHSVALPFVAAYHRLGPYLLGNPLTEPYRERGVLVQVFEHLRLELHGTGVVAGALGSDLHPPAPRHTPVPTTASRRYFPRTGQVLSGDLLTFWRTHGGEALFGEPISGLISQRNGDGSGRSYPTQWFEHARLEIHPEIKNPRFHVLLGLIGRGLIAKRGWA